MNLTEYKQKIIRDAFNQRMRLDMDNPPERQICDNCDEQLVFALQDKNTTFSVGISTILQCLYCAESEGCVPPLPQDWWEKAKTANDCVQKW